jgi:hypothetical protein
MAVAKMGSRHPFRFHQNNEPKPRIRCTLTPMLHISATMRIIPMMLIPASRSVEVRLMGTLCMTDGVRLSAVRRQRVSGVGADQTSPPASPIPPWPSPDAARPPDKRSSPHFRSAGYRVPARPGAHRLVIEYAERALTNEIAAEDIDTLELLRQGPQPRRLRRLRHPSHRARTRRRGDHAGGADHHRDRRSLRKSRKRNNPTVDLARACLLGHQAHQAQQLKRIGTGDKQRRPGRPGLQAPPAPPIRTRFNRPLLHANKAKCHSF